MASRRRGAGIYGGAPPVASSPTPSGCGSSNSTISVRTDSKPNGVGNPGTIYSSPKKRWKPEEYTTTTSGSTTSSSAISLATSSSVVSSHHQQQQPFYYDTRNVLSQQDAGSYRCEEEDCWYLCSSIVVSSTSSHGGSATNSTISSTRYYRTFHALIQLVEWLYTKGKRGTTTMDSSLALLLFRSYRIRKSLLETLSTASNTTTTEQPLFTMTLATLFSLLSNICQKKKNT
jgi:hypothetical protein